MAGEMASSQNGTRSDNNELWKMVEKYYTRNKPQTSHRAQKQIRRRKVKRTKRSNKKRTNNRKNQVTRKLKNKPKTG